MAGTSGGKARPVRQISLPPLTEFDGERLEPGRDYDAISFADRDFTGEDATDSRFVECHAQRCCLEGVSMRRAHIVDCLLTEVHGASVDFSDSTWRDTHMTRGRLGALTLAGATLKGIRLRGIKLGFVNIAAARLDDVVFEDCEIGGLDARAAQMRSVRFLGCTVEELNVAEATLSKVDLSGAKMHALIGVGSLRGAIVNHDQLVDLAPLFAAELGVEVHEG